LNVLLWILFAVFLLVLLLIFTPVHAEITYHAEGFSGAVRILFLRFRFPREKRKAEKGSKPKEDSPKEKQGGDLKRLISLIRLGIKAAGKRNDDQCGDELHCIKENSFYNGRPGRPLFYYVGNIVPIFPE